MGMPFYFKDLRDKAYIFFRAYIESIVENVSPSWNSDNYIGRSEPVFTYSNTQRDISFTLKLFAHTEAELKAIYIKLNRLTSMCYPEYKPDARMRSKVRMKPPLTQLRIGELYGSPNEEMSGFIKSISYSIPESAPWETKKGMRVPKHVIASISYQVIHTESPSLKFAQQGSGFYGITRQIGVE